MASFVDSYNNMADGGKITPFQSQKSVTTLQKPSGAKGLFSKFVSSLAQPFGEIGKAVVNTPGAIYREIQNKPINDIQQKTFGTTNSGQIAKKVGGDLAQIGATVVPVGKIGEGAGLFGKIAAGAKTGAKVGAVGGAGSALANNQNVASGALSGAAMGGLAGGIASPVLDKLLPGASKGATTVAPPPTSALEATRPTLLSKLNNHAQQLEAGAGGSGAGARLPGSQPTGISLAKSQDITQLGDKHGIPAGSPTTRLQYIQNKLNAAGADLNSKLHENNVPLSHEDLQAIADEFHGKIGAMPNAQTLSPHAQALSSHFLGQGEPPNIGGQPVSPALAAKLGLQTETHSPVTDLKSLNGYKQGLDEMINHSRNSDTVDPAQEQAAHTMRQVINDQIGKYAPAVKGANQTFSELKTLEAPALMENNNIHNTGGGLYNRLLNNNIVKGAESMAGRAGQKLTGGVGRAAQDGAAGSAIAPIEAAASKPASNSLLSKVRANPQVNNSAKQAVIAGSAEATANPNAGSKKVTTQQLQDVIDPQDAIKNEAINHALDQAQSPNNTNSSGDAYSAEQLISDINNDPKNASTYLGVFNALKSQNSNKLDSLTSSQQKDVSTGEAAAGVLNNYMQQLSGTAGNDVASGELAKLVGHYGGGLAPESAKNAYAQSVQRNDVASQLASALVGGGKPSQQLISRIADSLPQVGDSGGVKQDKFNKLMQNLQTVIKTQATPVSQFLGQLQQ